MGTILDFDRARPDLRPAVTAPAGCKGAACPAFARCQGRCETKRAEILMWVPASAPAASSPA